MNLVIAFHLDSAKMAANMETKTYHTNAPEVQNLVRAAFPEYHGRRFVVEAFCGPMTLTSYWSGRSRDYWAFVNMTSGAVGSVPENGTPFVRDGEQLKIESLPQNVAIVRWSRGPYESAAVYVGSDNLAKFLPPTELIRDQRIVLSATRSLKSSYARIKDYRFHEARQLTGIDRLAWDQAKAELITKGMLNKAGTIMDAGRNAIGHTDLYQIGKEQSLASAA